MVWSEAETVKDTRDDPARPGVLSQSYPRRYWCWTGCREGAGTAHRVVVVRFDPGPDNFVVLVERMGEDAMGNTTWNPVLEPDVEAWAQGRALSALARMSRVPSGPLEELES